MVGGTGKNAINKLGEAQILAFIRNAKAGMSTKTKLADGGGMYLTLTASARQYGGSSTGSTGKRAPTPSVRLPPARSPKLARRRKLRRR